MFASRIRGVAGAAGIPIELVSSPAALRSRVERDPPRRILIDLDARGWDPIALIRELRAGPAPTTEIIAWVSHVRADAIQAAREAGADRVLARSAFSRQVQEWISLTSCSVQSHTKKHPVARSAGDGAQYDSQTAAQAASASSFSLQSRQ